MRSQMTRYIISPCLNGPIVKSSSGTRANDPEHHGHCSMEDLLLFIMSPFSSKIRPRTWLSCFIH